MNIWCPDCGSTSFYYTNIAREESTDEANPSVILTDHMKCKKCSKEFDIKWYEYVRNTWIDAQPRIFNRKR